MKFIPVYAPAAPVLASKAIRVYSHSYWLATFSRPIAAGKGGRGGKILENLRKRTQNFLDTLNICIYSYMNTVTAYLLTVVWYKNHRQSKQDETPEKLTVWV